MVTSNLNASPDRIPVGRFGMPHEVADVAVMLASNAVHYGPNHQRQWRLVYELSAPFRISVKAAGVLGQDTHRGAN